jgi:hypothetical protein
MNNDNHTISEIVQWYHRFTGAHPPQDHDAVADFDALQQLAFKLQLLQDGFPNPGSISVVLPSSQEPDLSVLHRAVTVSHSSTYALRYLFQHSVWKFYCNFSLQEVNNITPRKTVKVSLMEFLVVMNRMLLSQATMSDYPNIHENDLPYRSRSWVLSLMEYLEVHYIPRYCGMDEFESLNDLVGRVIEVYDYYEIALIGNEARFLWDHVI